MYRQLIQSSLRTARVCSYAFENAEWFGLARHWRVGSIYASAVGRISDQNRLKHLVTMRGAVFVTSVGIQKDR